MSTILKALRRLEQEKTRADRPLREQVTGPDREGPDEGNPPRRWPILLGGIGAGIGAGLAVLYLLVGRGDSKEETVGGAPATGVAAVSPQVPPARRAMRPAVPAPRPAPPRSEPATAADLEPLDEVAVIDRGTLPPRIAEESAPAPSAAPADPPPGSVRPFQHADPRELPGRHPLPQEAPAGAQPGARATAPPALPPKPAAAAIPAPPAPEAAQAEPVREADPEFAPKAPPTPLPKAEPAPPKPAPPKPHAPAPPAPPAVALPVVEHTTWHPIAERRVAVVKLPGGGTQSVHEGELVAGALVKRIEPSGVVFEHAGRELRRKIGE